MSNFVQHLQNNYQYLDTQAILLYRAAENRYRARPENVGKNDYGADDIDEELYPMLASQLASVDLLDHKTFKKLSEKCDSWNALCENQELFMCFTVQQTLRAALLEECQKRQVKKLIAECEKYKNYLISMFDQKCGNSQQFNDVLGIDEMMVFSNSINEEQSSKYGVRATNHPASADDELNRLRQKWKMTQDLSATLGGDERLDVQLVNFREKLILSRNVIARNRDSVSIIFLKEIIAILLPVLTAGLGLFFTHKLFETRGMHFIHKLDRILPEEEFVPIRPRF